MTRQIRLNAFDMNCVGHIQHGMWAHPRDQSMQYTDLDHWVKLARTLEHGLFDGLFLADILGVYDVYRDGPDASIRNGARAVELAQQAERLSEAKDPALAGTLAAAYAEAGRFGEAVATAQRALEQATAQTNTAQVETLRVRLKLYQSGSPFRDSELLPRKQEKHIPQ